MTQFEIPEIPWRQLMWWTLGVAAVVLCFWLLIRFQEILLLLVTALILSTAVRPSTLWLEKHGIAKPIGLLLIFSLVGILLVVLIWATVPVLVEQGAALGKSVAEGYQLLYQNLDQSTNILVRRFAALLPADLGSAASGGGQALPDLEMPVTPQATQGEPIVVGIAQAVAVIIFTFYWTLEGEYVRNALFMMLPLKKRNAARDLVQKMEQTVGGYLLGQGLLCLIIGALAFVAYLLIGLPHALLLAVFAGLLEAVPIVGPFLGAVPAFIIGLSVSPATALWVVLATAVIQQLENSLLVPRVMSQTIGIRPLVSLLALVAFGSLYGALGALIALPLAGIFQLLLDRYLLSHESLEQEEAGRDQLGVLRYETNQLVQDVRNQVRHKEGVPSAVSDFVEDELESLALDLESFLATQGEGLQ